MESSRPGRNDPCPCGSGRKYKACCLAADGKARDAGVGGVPLTPQMIARIRTEEVWQAELVPFRRGIADDPGARPTVALVTAGDWVISGELHRRPSGEPDAVADILADAVLAAADRIGARPISLEVRHAQIVSRLQTRLAPRGIEVIRVLELDSLDPVATGMVERSEHPMDWPGPRRPSMCAAESWSGWALPESTVVELFEAAATYHRARPWQGLDDDAPLFVETAEGRVWAATVLGSSDIESGLSLYSDIDDRDWVVEAPPWMLPLRDFVGHVLCVTLNRSADLPSAMQHEVMRSGWTVAAPEAYPHLFTVNTPGGGVSESDVRDLATALRALAAGGKVLAGAWARQEEGRWRDPQTGVVVRLDRRHPSGLDFSTGVSDGDGGTASRILPAGSTVHRVHLTLDGMEPPVWRRFEVPSDLPLWALHEVVQAVMGWENSHLYRFEVGGVEYGEPDEDGRFDEEDLDVSLSELAVGPDAHLTYLYDFGDQWSHDLRVEAVEPAEPDMRYPRCLDGARACPPEDSGGILGYEELLAALDGEGSAEWIEWVGGDFDPEAFDVDETNRRLQTLPGGIALDPACEARLDEVLTMLDEAAFDDDLPDELVEEAAELLEGFAVADPNGFLAGRKLEILVAAALHAAGMLLDTPWSGWRPTLEELAGRWDVSTASISNRSLEMRDRVPRPTAFDQIITAATARMQAQMQEMFEELASLGMGFPGTIQVAGVRSPADPFALDDLADAAELGDQEVESLRLALERGLADYRKSMGQADPVLRSLGERLRDPNAFGAGLRAVLRDDEVLPTARDALARWVLGRLAGMGSLIMTMTPTSSLLALNHLVANETLRGEALRSAVTMALALAPAPTQDVEVEEVRPLVRALGSDPEVEHLEKVALLVDLLEQTDWGRDGRRGPALVGLIAGEEAIPEMLRANVLALVGGIDDPAAAIRESGPATRRRALVERARLDERPETFVQTLLEVAVDDDVAGLAAAELLESYGSALPLGTVEALVRRGLGHHHAPVRQAFYRSGRPLLGDRMLDLASDEVLTRARQEARGSTHPDQTSLF